MSLFLMQTFDDAPVYIVCDERETENGWQTTVIESFTSEETAQHYFDTHAHLYIKQ